jgi:hypothetical protein
MAKPKGRDLPQGRASAPSVLAAHLEHALLRELVAEYKRINHVYFKRTLVTPAIELVATESRLGRFCPATRTIELAKAMVLTHSWGVVVEVLKHEVAHQYVHEVLGETSETPHGPAFRQVCERLGIDGRAAGLPRIPSPRASPDSDGAEGQKDERIVERVARLLALAESPNVHEAEAAASAAQRLMLRYNLDARRHAALHGYGFAHVGTPTGRVSEAERILAMVLGRHFFVEVIWVPVYRPHVGKRGSVLELCGTPQNLAMAEYVHGYLTRTAEDLWADHRRALRLPGNRDRRTFIAGVMTGFADKLQRQAKVHQEEGLVWVGDANLADYFHRRHRHVVHVRYAGTRKTDAYSHGRAAGRRIVLRKGVEAGPSNQRRFLPAPKD